MGDSSVEQALLNVKSTQEENTSRSWVVILFLTPEDCLKQSM